MPSPDTSPTRASSDWVRLFNETAKQQPSELRLRACRPGRHQSRLVVHAQGVSEAENEVHAANNNTEDTQVKNDKKKRLRRKSELDLERREQQQAEQRVKNKSALQNLLSARKEKPTRRLRGAEAQATPSGKQKRRLKQNKTSRDDVLDDSDDNNSEKPPATKKRRRAAVASSSDSDSSSSTDAQSSSSSGFNREDDSDIHSYVDAYDSDRFIVDSDEDAEAEASPPPFDFDPEAARLAQKTSKKRKRKSIMLHSQFHDSSSESDHAQDDSDSEESGQPGTDKPPVDWRAEMPAEFSSAAKQPLSFSFNALVQMLASEILEPGFIEDVVRDRDPYFLLSVGKLETLVGGKKNALGLSSIWTAEFRATLEKYPRMRTVVLSPSEYTECDVCRRSGRIATLHVTLSGQPYEYDTMQALDEPKGEATFYVGRFCKRRAQIYHDLHHFKIHIMDDVREQLDVVKKRFAQEYEDRGPAFLVQYLLADNKYLNSLLNNFKQMLENVESYAGED